MNKHKLIKIDDYWIVVSDEEPKEGNLCFNRHALNHPKYKDDIIAPCSKNAEINWQNNMSYNNGTTFLRDNYHKMIASQNPAHNLPSIIFSDEVAKKLGIVDIEKLSSLKWDENHPTEKQAYKQGYNQCLSDNKDKRFTLEDMKRCWDIGIGLGVKWQELSNPEKMGFDKFIQSLTKNTWDVELEVEYKGEYLAGTCGDNEIWAEYPNEPKITNNSLTVKHLI